MGVRYNGGSSTGKETGGQQPAELQSRGAAKERVSAYPSGEGEQRRTKGQMRFMAVPEHHQSSEAGEG